MMSVMKMLLDQCQLLGIQYMAVAIGIEQVAFYVGQQMLLQILDSYQQYFGVIHGLMDLGMLYILGMVGKDRLVIVSLLGCDKWQAQSIVTIHRRENLYWH